MDSSQHIGAESSFQDPDDQLISQAILEARYTDWRLKYDSIVDELEECKAARRQTENRLAIYENEVVQRENCHKAELMQLMQKLQNAEVKICMLEAESREASKSAFIRVADLDLTDATPLNLASKSLKPEKESEAVLPCSEAGWGGDNEVAEKENSAEPQISRPPSSLRTPSPLTTSGRHTLSIDEALRPESPNMDEVTRLKRRLVVARHLVEELNNRNGSLSQELLSVQSLYKMDVQTLREKITVLTENLESERNAHLLRSGELNRQIQSLHGRIGELLKDRESIMSENANLSAKVNSLKELTQRLRRQHATELDQMNQLVQDRDGTIYELSAFLSSNPVYLDDGAPASVQPDDVQSEPLEVHTKSAEASRPITRRIHTTDISQSVIVDLEPPPSNQPAPPNETLPLGEVTQYCHSETSSVFNDESRREQTAFIDIAESCEPEAQPEVTRLQRELTRVKSNLIAQVKTNTRLRAAYNALALSLPSAARSVNRSTALALSEADKGISPFLRMSKLTPRERSQASLSRSYTFGDGVAYENQPDPLEETSAHLHAALDQLKLDLSQSGGDVPAAAAATTATPGVADGQPATDFAHRSRVLSPIAESEAPEGANPPVPPTADGPEDLTQPGSLRKLRDLYSVIRNLLLHLDDVRAVQRSFVETINRSCAANVSLNETGLAASRVQHYSFTCDPVQKQSAEEAEAEEQPLPTAVAAAGEVGVDEVSRRSSSTRTPTAAVGSEHLDSADDTEQVCSVAQERDETEVSQRHNVSFFNGTIAELRHNYPASPEVSVSLGAEEEEEGRDAQPSATVSSSSVLNKTFPLTQPQPPQQLMATLRQSAALANSMTNVSYSFEHSGFGNVTFVELTNRKVFDRLSQAMVKLRNAIEECSVVVSDDLLHLAPGTAAAAAAPPTGLFGVSPAFHGAPEDQRPISLASDSTITQTAGDAGKSLLTNTEAIFNYDDVSDVSSATLDSPRCSQPGQAGDVQPPGPHSEAEGGKESQAINLDPQLSEMAHSLLTRFVHVMARVQTVATSMGASVRSTGDVNNSGAAQPVSKGDTASDPAASPGRGHPDSPRQITAAFEAWSERARDWFSAFNAALRDPTFLPFIEGKLTALEEDFLQMFAELEQARQAREAKATQCVCRLKATHKCIIDLLASSGKTSEEQFQAYLALQTKCEVLSSELGASVPVSEHHALQTEYARVRSAYEKLLAQHRRRQPSLDRPSEELEEAICNSVSELDAATMPSPEHPNLQIEYSRLKAAQDDLETRPEDSVPRADHEELLKRYRQLTADYGSLSDELREAKHDYEQRLRTTVPTQEHEALRSEFSRLSATYEELAALVESTVSRTVYERLAEEHRNLQEVQESVSKELKLMKEEFASKMAASIPLTEHEALQTRCSKLEADCNNLLSQLDSTIPRSEYERLRDEHRRLESEYGDLSQELENLKEELASKMAASVPLTEHEALQSKCSKLQADCNNLFNQLDSTVPRPEHEMLRDEHHRLESEYRELSQELENVRAELASKITASVPLTEHEVLQSKCSKLQADCQHLLTKLDSTVPSTEHETLRDEHRRLESEYRDLSQELEQLKEELASKMAASVPLTEHEALQSKCSKLQADCNNLLNQLDSTVPRSEYEALQDEHRRLESEYTNLSQELENAYRKEFDEIVERYAAILDIANSKQASVEAQCEALAEREQQLTQELADKDAIIADLEAHMTEIQAAADAAEVAAQEAAAARPKEEVEGVFGEGSLSAEADRRVRKYPELRAIAIDLKEKLVRRTRRLETTLHEVRRLRAIIKEDETRAKNILGQMERLREQVLQKNHIIRQLEALVPQVLTSAHATVRCSVGVQVGRGRQSKSRTLAADPSPPDDVPAVELPRASSAVCASPFTLPPVPPVAVTGTASPTFCIAEGHEGTATSRSSPLLGIHSDLAPRMALAVNKSSPQTGCSTCFHLSSPPASTALGVIQYAQGPMAVVSSSRQSSTRFPTPPPLPPTCTESADSSRTNLVEVSSLMSDLLSVSQDFSKRLRTMQQTVSQLQSPPQTDAVSLPDSLSSTSSITCPSPDKGQTADMQVVSVLKEDIARCASQLSHLCSNLVARLMPMHLDSPSVNPTVGEIQFSGCTFEAHRKARGLIRRVVRHLSASFHPDSSESYVADALADLRVVLSLLKTRPTSAPERLEVNICQPQPQQQQHSLPQSSLDPQPPLGRHSHLRREEMAGNLRDISAMLSETDNRLAASCSSLREFVALATASDLCRLPIIAGPCKARLARYGFDTRVGTCTQFIYGGCDQNRNNFHTKEECEEATAHCPVEVHTTENLPVGSNICHMPFEIGDCEDYDERYGYDPQLGICKPYLFSGCGGNANNFLTLQECENATKKCVDEDFDALLKGRPIAPHVGLQQGDLA
ncbi:zinc-containing alcohol dehydrogenase [Sparganum proliferum]